MTASCYWAGRYKNTYLRFEDYFIVSIVNNNNIRIFILFCQPDQFAEYIS